MIATRGLKTSEFGIVVANIVATVLLNAGIIESDTAGELRNLQASAIGMAVVSVAYVLQRGYVKGKANGTPAADADPVAELRRFREKLTVAKIDLHRAQEHVKMLEDAETQLIETEVVDEGQAGTDTG